MKRAGSGPFEDPAWVCARGPPLATQDVGAGLVGSFKQENQGLFGPWAASSTRPHPTSPTESLLHDRVLMEPKEKAPRDEVEDHHSLVIASKSNIIPSEKSHPPLLSVFGRSLFFWGSSGQGDCCGSKGVMEPLRMASDDGSE